jgi:hypothetical protein
MRIDGSAVLTGGSLRRPSRHVHVAQSLDVQVEPLNGGTCASTLSGMTGGAADHLEGVSFLVDLGSGKAERMEDLTFAVAGLKEREDLERWVTEHPEIVGPDLLLVTTEFDKWALRGQKVSDRLDVLLLDRSGSLVVAELKRDRASDSVELQALKYAAYCSQLTVPELVEDYAAFHDVGNDAAMQRVVEHAPSLQDNTTLGPVRIRLVAGSFGPAVTSVVLWLREHEIDIGCVEVRLRRVPGSRSAVLSTRQLLPLPEAEDYWVRRERKEREEKRALSDSRQWTWEEYSERFGPETVAIARRLYQGMEGYVHGHQLPWTGAMRQWWLGYQRPGGYYVAYVGLYVERPVDLRLKLPADPARLGLADPYPALRSWWEESSREWKWEVPTLADVPDVAAALDLARPHHPVTGPMPRP